MKHAPTTNSGASLRRAVLTALALAVLAWVAASFAIARNILVDSMIEHELDDGDALGRRTLRLVDAELARIDLSARDWATWDETWAYARGEDEGYVARNVYDDVLKNLKIDMMAIVGADGGARLVRMRNPDTPPPDPIPALLGRDGAWLEAQRSDSAQQGLVRTARGPLAFVAFPIHRSQPDAPGASAGTLVFARFLDETFVAELRRIMHAELSLHTPDDAAQPDVGQALRHLGDDGVHVSLPDDKRLVTYAVLRDLWGQPIAVLRAVMERSAYAQARRAERGLLLASLAIGLAAGLGFYGFMVNRVLAPLQRLDAAVRDVARDVAHEGGSARLPPSSVDDEFARLGRSVNAMLDELDAQRDAREARDAAQLASRMKGELLVNLGQTTTAPLADLESALEDALRDDGLSPSTRARLDEAYRAAFRLATELRGLPEFSRETHGEAAAAPFAFREFIEQIADVAAARATARGVAVDCEIDPALAAHYLGDAGRLQSVLNLLFEELEAEAPAEDLLVRARLAAAGTQHDSIDLSVSRCGPKPGEREAAERPAVRRDEEGMSRLRQAVAALGGLLHGTDGGHQITVQWPRIAGTADTSPRPYSGRRVLVLGAPRVSRDILEAYLKSLGCQVVTAEAVLTTTPRDVALAVVLVDESRAGVSLQSALPGTPTLFVLPAGVPPPAARPDTAYLHRPLHWSALRGVLDEFWSPQPASEISLQNPTVTG
ncbi:MAG TPA: CHASE4 domain-containing protein [Gammaproteobacteria bacterium]|nr:CHASE4 domain-containing protein [Gammaproteobacteria bacterium]